MGVPQRAESLTKPSSITDTGLRSVDNPLTLNYLIRYSLPTFPHSQGSPGLQQAIFKHTHTTHPDWRITDEFKLQLLPQLQRMTAGAVRYSDPLPRQEREHTQFEPRTKVVHAHFHRPERIVEEIQDRLDDMQEIFNSDSVQPMRQNLFCLTKTMISRDFHFLASSLGRIRSNPDPSKPMSDPWLSFLCHFGLTKNPDGIRHTTDVVELDMMYADIERFIREGNLSALDREYDAMFDHVLTLHNEKHPDNVVVW